jgi:hypothetical protein
MAAADGNLSGAVTRAPAKAVVGSRETKAAKSA